MRAWPFLLIACDSGRAPPPAPAAQSLAIRDAAADAPRDVAADATAAPPDASIHVTPAAALPMRVLAGPFASLRAYCVSVKPQDIGDYEEYDVHCDVEPTFSGRRRVARAQPPFDDARLVVLEALDTHCQLAIKTGGKWYVLNEAVRCISERSKSTLETKVTAFDVEDFVAGASPELVVRAAYDQSTQDYDPETYTAAQFEALVVCGVGASGIPRCTRELPVRGHLEDHDKRVTKTKFALAIRAGPDAIVIDGDTSTVPRYQFDALTPGSYALGF